MRIFEEIRNNKIYIALFVFIILVNLTAYISSNSKKEESVSLASTSETSEGEKAETQPRMKAVPTEEEIQAQKDKFSQLMSERPVLYLFIVFFQLLIILTLIIGFFLDWVFVAKWIKKKSPNIRLVYGPDPEWTITDIFRVILIFISCGYVFAILQGPFIKYIPILGNYRFSMIFNTGIMNIGAVAVILYFVVRKYGQNIIALGISFKKALPAVFIGIVGYVCVIPVIFVIMAFTLVVVRFFSYEPPVQPIVDVFMAEKQVSVLGAGIFFAAICGPIAEEIFFRGFMYGAIKKKMGAVWSILITSSIFSLLHTHWIGFLPIMVLGILLAYLYEKTGSIIPSMTVHIIHNVGTVIMVFIAKYFNA